MDTKTEFPNETAGKRCLLQALRAFPRIRSWDVPTWLLLACCGFFTLVWYDLLPNMVTDSEHQRRFGAELVVRAALALCVLLNLLAVFLDFYVRRYVTESRFLRVGFFSAFFFCMPLLGLLAMFAISSRLPLPYNVWNDKIERGHRYEHKKNFSKAEQALKEALDYASGLSSRDLKVAESNYELSRFYLEQKRFDDAIARADLAIRLFKAADPEESVHTVKARIIRAKALEGKSGLAVAKPEFEQVIQAHQKINSRVRWSSFNRMHAFFLNYTDHLLKSNELEEADRVANLALAHSRHGFYEDADESYQAMLKLAEVKIARKELAVAEVRIGDLIVDLEKRKPKSKLLRSAYRMLAELYEANGKPEKAGEIKLRLASFPAKPQK